MRINKLRSKFRFRVLKIFENEITNLLFVLSVPQSVRFSSHFEAVSAGFRFWVVHVLVACENIRLSSLFAAGDVSLETSPAAKSEKKQMFSQGSAVARAI